MTFTAQDKIDAIKREIGKRKYVFRGFVSEQKLTQAKASREIAVMEAIAEDNEAEAAKERLL